MEGSWDWAYKQSKGSDSLMDCKVGKRSHLINNCFKKKKSKPTNLRSSAIETVITFLSITGTDIGIRMLKSS